MKAIVYEKYGTPDVLHIGEVPRPEPKEGEVLVKVKASSVNFVDAAATKGDPLMLRFMTGIFKPNKIIGADISGIVEAVGPSVSELKVGDEVYGDLSDSGLGGYAEYVVVKETIISKKPKSLSFEESAAFPQSAVVALQALRNQGNLKPGQSLLINGAAGGIGTFAIQIAKLFGAEVTAVCGTENLDLVKSLGADHVIDYKKEDFTKNGKAYDLIIDIVAYRTNTEYKKSLTAEGKCIIVGGKISRVLQSAIFAGAKVKSLVVKINKKDLDYITELVESGKLKPVIDSVFKLEDASLAVKRYGESGVRGKVIISID